ncbi:FCD domain-containing protein [Salipiger sp. IMCC34102]|uniref:GntR family transcriptional regulator n=1 Tax=Salipiger sp. IMCC34102 TaxID=2510647 RepID=UPI00101D0772|nr:GntR family transcriptional regulator [Salipiger sp. IMCC34102]RYH04445.1 FCD domain-containing protein [Salipiger sp. IMCC34102]
MNKVHDISSVIHKFDISAYEGETVGDITFRRLRTDIVHGRLKPGEKLKLDKLKTKYSASVSTLREILCRLAVEDLVTAEGQRGFEVAPVSRSGLQDIAELRILLETYALRRSIAEGDLDWEGNVVSAHHKLASVERDLIGGSEEQVALWVQQDWGFHHATISGCHAPALMQTHSSVFDRFIRYHMLVLSFRGKPASDEHAKMRDLVVTRKTDAAIELLTKHIRSGVAHILDSGQIQG